MLQTRGGHFQHLLQHVNMRNIFVLLYSDYPNMHIICGGCSDAFGLSCTGVIQGIPLGGWLHPLPKFVLPNFR